MEDVPEIAPHQGASKKIAKVLVAADWFFSVGIGGAAALLCLIVGIAKSDLGWIMWGLFGAIAVWFAIYVRSRVSKLNSNSQK